MGGQTQCIKKVTLLQGKRWPRTLPINKNAIKLKHLGNGQTYKGGEKRQIKDKGKEEEATQELSTYLQSPTYYPSTWSPCAFRIQNWVITFSQVLRGNNSHLDSELTFLNCWLKQLFVQTLFFAILS